MKRNINLLIKGLGNVLVVFKLSESLVRNIPNLFIVSKHTHHLTLSSMLLLL